MFKSKKIFSTLIAIGLITSTVSVYATVVNDDAVYDKNNGALIERTSKGNTYRITDPLLIEEELKKDGMEGYDVSEIITYIQLPKENQEKTNEVLLDTVVNDDAVYDKNNGVLIERTGKGNTYRITDPLLIEEELKKDGMEGYDVSEIITYIQLPKENQDIMNNISPYFWNKYSIRNTNDKGSLWYFENRDYAPVSGGPGGKITLSDSRKSEYTFNGSIGLSAKVIEAGLGIELKNDYTISRQYEKNLAPREVGVVKSWAYFDKYTYDIYKGDKYDDNGNIYIPNLGVRYRYYKLQS